MKNKKKLWTTVIKYHDLLSGIRKRTIEGYINRNYTKISCLQSAWFQWSRRRDVPLGKPIMYGIAVNLKL